MRPPTAAPGPRPAPRARRASPARGPASPAAAATATRPRRRRRRRAGRSRARPARRRRHREARRRRPRPRAPRATRRRRPPRPRRRPGSPPPVPALALVLALLCLAAAAGGGLPALAAAEPHLRGLVDLRRRPRRRARRSTPTTTRTPRAASQGKLDVLTGDLREQYEEDLGAGRDHRHLRAGVGDDQLRGARRRAAAGQRGPGHRHPRRLRAVRRRVGEQRRPGRRPEGSECQVTPEGAQSCTQTVQVARRAGRRRLEDQRAHPPHHQLTPGSRRCGRVRQAPRGVAVPLEGVSAGIMGPRTPCAPRSTGRCPRDVAPVAPAPPTWTARSSRGRVSCCAAL